MKIYKVPLLAIVMIMGVLFACKKNVLRVSPFDTVDGRALVKINYACPYYYKTSAPVVPNRLVKIRMNGNIVSNYLTYTTPFPGGGLNTGGNNYSDYLSMPPGKNTISIIIPYIGTDKDSIVLYTTEVDLKANLFQTVHISDTLVDATTNNTNFVLTIDPSQKPDSGYVLYRFVNLIPNAGPLDLYFGPDKIISGIGYKEASDTFRLQAGNSLAWTLRKKDSTTTLGSSYTSSSTVANQRVFTVYARGYDGLPTSDTRSPKVSLLYVK
ncbi:MAG: DUF4397 domain-containing protein [Niabella sp.]